MCRIEKFVKKKKEGLGVVLMKFKKFNHYINRYTVISIIQRYLDKNY